MGICRTRRNADGVFVGRRDWQGQRQLRRLWWQGGGGLRRSVNILRGRAELSLTTVEKRTILRTVATHGRGFSAANAHVRAATPVTVKRTVAYGFGPRPLRHVEVFAHPTSRAAV